MRGTCPLLVASTAATITMSTIPTGIWCDWWLRSPGTKRYDSDAYCVALNGGVFDTVNIGVSYGRTSSLRSRTSTTPNTTLGGSSRPVSFTATLSTTIPTEEKSPGIGSSGGGVCSNRYGVTENVGYMNDVAISYGPVSGHEKTIRHVNIWCIYWWRS